MIRVLNFRAVFGFAGASIKLATFFVLICFFEPAVAGQSDWGRFEGVLRLEDVASDYERDVPDDVGHTEFKLLNDYTFITKDDLRYTVPEGYVINGASIPRVVWTVIGGPWSGRYRNASVIHDHMVDVRFEDSATVHRLFYEAMRASSVDETLAKIMYFAVLKGGSHWEKGTGFFPPTVTSGSISRDELIRFIEQIETQALSLKEVEKLGNQ